ncbi:CrcB family protein [Streptomyces sp. DSM 44915]|uniref:Fluoride-specific ion channel FluC n=1 Tax=Streptomyces chisholmiae TaxID=3075540 RepID=A0ABU2K0E8_9ACTN|nr:CrcB family protein [Streptomyces sp. DSM 44915]MDT0270459.1 CrcB family protein [Streptomyces sp. DSM 44915]
MTAEPSAGSEPIDPDLPAPSARPREPAVVAAVALGGALGALARYAAALRWPTEPGAFPWTTLGVNTVGCVLIGCFLVLVTEVPRAHPLLRPLVATGVLGGFTTLSTYAVDVELLLRDGRLGAGLGVLLGTLGCALLAVTGGAWGARRALRPLLARRAARAQGGAG